MLNSFMIVLHLVFTLMEELKNEHRGTKSIRALRKLPTGLLLLEKKRLYTWDIDGTR